MAYTKQLLDLRSNSGIRDVSGVCHDSAKFADQVNAVTERLCNRGNWWQTEVLLRLCFQGCHIVWPRIVGTVLGVKFCHGSSVQIKNNWWAVVGSSGCGWCGDAVMRDDGTRPCYNEVSGNTGKYIRYHIANNKDIGKTIKLFGFKYGNQPLQEQDLNGNWQMGLTLTTTQTGAQTTELVTRITNIVRQPTQGRTWLY